MFVFKDSFYARRPGTYDLLMDTNEHCKCSKYCNSLLFFFRNKPRTKKNWNNFFVKSSLPLFFSFVDPFFLSKAKKFFLEAFFRDILRLMLFCISKSENFPKHMASMAPRFVSDEKVNSPLHLDQLFVLLPWCAQGWVEVDSKGKKNVKLMKKSGNVRT